MRPDEQAQRAAVVAEGRTWRATAYHHHARIKGVGADCAQLLCAVYEACGLVPHVDPGHYPHDWHLHHGEELYIHWLQRCGAREVQTPAPGDVALFRFGRTWSHGGIVTEPGWVLHAYLGRGVIETRLSEDPLGGREPRYWSLWAPEGQDAARAERWAAPEPARIPSGDRSRVAVAEG